MNELSPDRAVEALARRQHGVLLRRQAIAVGITPRMIDGRVASGSWVRLDRGIYELATHPFTWLRQAKAAELSVPGSAVSHRSAAVLHGVPGFRPGRIEVTVAPGSSSRSPFATVHRRPVFHTVACNGIRVTTLERVVFDLAVELAPSAVRDLVHDVVVRRMTTVPLLIDEYERLRDLRPTGLAVVGGVLARQPEGQVPPANELERVLMAVLDDPRLPQHVSQAPFPWRPSMPERCDELIPDWRRIIEGDGRLWHTREADFERDRARDHEAQRHGYEVTRFTYHQLVDDPDYAVGVLLDIGARRVAA